MSIRSCVQKGQIISSTQQPKSCHITFFHILDTNIVKLLGTRVSCPKRSLATLLQNNPFSSLLKKDIQRVSNSTWHSTPIIKTMTYHQFGGKWCENWYTLNQVGGQIRLKYLSEYLQSLRTALKNSVLYCSNSQMQQLCGKNYSNYSVVFWFHLVKIEAETKIWELLTDEMYAG